MNTLLTLNTGSSSVKFRLFGWSTDLPLLAGGKISEIGGAVEFKAGKGDATQERVPLDNGAATHETAVEAVLEWLVANGFSFDDVRICAHRIVHGGERFRAPALLDVDTIEYLASLNSLAPLHQPPNLKGVEILAVKYPGMKQYGCFDTAFHAGHKEKHYSYALPEELRAQGIRRYGFHGQSYAWIAHCLRQDFPDLYKGRVVVAHLGNGASLCAMKNGRSVDTTMGMTALDGLPMGTRSGSIDPGVIFYSLRDLKLSLEEYERVLYEKSGLKGLSGITNDVKTLSASNNPRAKFALDYFAWKTAQYIAAMVVSIGGLDGLIFTGGIGENAKNIRNAILSQLAFLPPFKHHVIATNEERAMALEVWQSLQGT